MAGNRQQGHIGCEAGREFVAPSDWGSRNLRDRRRGPGVLVRRAQADMGEAVVEVGTMMRWMAKLLRGRGGLKAAETYEAGPSNMPTVEQQRAAYGLHVGGCQINGSACVEGCEAPQQGPPA